MSAIKFVILFALFAVSTADFLKCANNLPMPTNIQVDGCEGKTRCPLLRGTPATGLLDFVSVGTNTLRPNIIATAFGIRAPVELPVDIQNGCNHLVGSQCPLDKGEDATWKLSMPVAKEYPSLSVTIEITLYADNAMPEFCLIIEAEVV